MGWASATPICEEVWEGVRPFVPEADRIDALSRIIIAFQRGDWDTEDELVCAHEDEWPEARAALDKANAYWRRR